MTAGLAFAVVLARGSILKAIAMILVGLLFSTVGTDLETGVERMTFGYAPLADGLDFAILAMGVFGFAEVLRNLEAVEHRDVVRRPIGRLLPSRADLKRSALPVLRGSLVGAALGIIPGNGAVLGPFASYTLEKKLAKDPRRFGRGAIEGVAGPESANNAGAQTSFIPLLSLGIPPNAVMALMVGAMTIHGIVPGPARHDPEPLAVLGRHREHVDREPHAARHQPAAHRRVGAAPRGPLPPDVPGDPPLLLHRHLLDQQLGGGRAHERRARARWAGGS